MKRKLLTIILICLLMLAVSACGCKHQWANATCTTPMTCILCGETNGSPSGHAWVDATCTQARNCSICGTTEGTALEHSWITATCSTPKSCSLCGETDGEPLPHSIDTWVTTKDATCSETGVMEGLCKVCQEKSTKDITLLDHTPGDWVITKECTATTAGERSKTCTVCGAVVSTETFEMSAEEIESAFKAECITYTYKDIARSPGEYKGKKAKFTGEVIQVMQEEFYSMMIYVLRVNVTQNGRYYEDTVYVTYYADADAPRILEDDIITMYGTLEGEKTYETVMGSSVTIPNFDAEYIDIN